MNDQSVKDRLAEDVKTAMRARDQRRVSAIRMLRAAITTMEMSRTDRKDPKYGQPVLETDILAVIQKEIAQKRETIHFAQVGNRTELLEKEQLELDVMQEYLPQQLTREEIRAVVDEIITEVGPQFRAVMPVASLRLKGKADGRMVNEVVKEATS